MREEFETFIQQTVDPVRTGQRLDQLLADPAVYATLALVNPEQRHNLVTLLSAANFLCHQISQQPDILSGIGEISCPSDIDTESLQTFDELRLYKYRELLKICWMDISGHDYEDVLQALSTLAEVIVRTALRLCLDSSDYELVMRYMTIIAMGKLGAQELNLSSDVDLIIVSTNQDEYADDFQGLQHKLFNCVRLLSKNLEQKTEKGFLYRVDLKLRPWGESGALVVSNDYMLDYFASNARPWERFAWLRARPIAGNYDLANQLIKEINPMLFRKSLGADDLTRFIEIKNDMQRVRNRKGHWNVKLGNGGIRDIEFFVQMLQIVNGAREPDLQITNTLAVIKSLVRHGLILEHEADSITASYLFLRRLENRLQMVDELQTHNLPDAITSRKQLVYTLVPFDQQDDDLTLFEVLLKKHQDIAKKYFDRIIPVQNKRVYDEQMESFVSRTWYEDMAKASTQRWLELCNNESLGNIPEHIEKLIAIFGSSWYFTRHIFFRGYESAELIDSAHSLRYDYVSISEHLRVGSSSEEPEHRVEQLRQVKNDLMLQILTRFLEGYSDQLQTEIALSNLARGVFNSMLDIHDLSQPDIRKNISVLGMGRLAGDEMTFGSDLDLIFLVDTDSNSMDQSVFRKLRKLLRSLSAVSSFGVLYEVDMRLRPHGNAGALLTHASSFVEYHQQNRQTWERQMMTRVRVIMDDDILGAESLAKISPFIFGQYDEDELKSDILEMRIRVENEKGKQANTLNVKQGRGGIMDIDFICHYFQLLHGDEKPQFRSSSTRIILQELQQSEILGLSESDILLKSYDFLKRIETCVRLFDLKAISALQVDGKMMRAICRAMGFSDNIDQFQHAYSQVTNQVREIFHQHLGS